MTIKDVISENPTLTLFMLYVFWEVSKLLFKHVKKQETENRTTFKKRIADLTATVANLEKISPVSATSCVQNQAECREKLRSEIIAQSTEIAKTVQDRQDRTDAAIAALHSRITKQGEDISEKYTKILKYLIDIKRNGNGRK